MRRTIFYSWQSDLPNAANRSFIQHALENVGKSIAADSTIDVEPVIDRDTQGVAGAPDIARTIFEKIRSADVFVADVSVISGRRKGRPTPNPNVLIELGYALHALGEEGVVLVFNTAFGKIEQLPFDLKMRRAIAYNMPEASIDRATERKALEGRLDDAVRFALANPRKAMPDSIPNIETRLTKHKQLAVPKLGDVGIFGHVAIYCLPYGSIGLSVRELEGFAKKHRHQFSNTLRNCLEPETFQLGISLLYQPAVGYKSTATISLYRDGFIAFDSQADIDMSRNADVANTLNPYWLCYEIQRQLQLAKAVLGPHGAARIKTIVELDHIEKLSLLVTAGPFPSGTRKLPYGGSHEPILRDIDLPEIHDHNGPNRNVIMQPVRDIMDEVCGIFKLSEAPSDLSDEDGRMVYVKGQEGSR